MKKIFLLSILLFQLTFVFGQERDNVGHRVGPWNIGAPQQGITWKIRRSYYSDNSEKFTNEIEIKNTNNSTVTFSYNISEYANETNTRYRKTLAPNGIYTSTYCPNAQSVYFYVELSNGQTTNNQTNSSNQQNDPTFDKNNASFQDYYKRATSAGQAGNYDEAISLWKSAISVAVNDDQRNNARAWLAEAEKAKANSNNQANNAEVQRKQQLLIQQQEQQRQQQIQQSVNQLTTATVDLVTYFANRKNALRNSLTQEDGQALMNIVNSENPEDYTQNIIQIFTDLGYTYREIKKDNSGFSPMTIITMNNDVNNINDFLSIFIHKANYSDYNSITFSYNRKKKLFEQLGALGNNLEGGYARPEIKGVPPSRIEKVEQKRILEEQKKAEAINKIEALKPTETEKVVENTITPQGIIDKYILALGGTEKLKSVQDITIIELDPNNYKEETKRAYGKYLFAMVRNNGEVITKTVFNGEIGYYGHKKTKITDETDINSYKKTQPFGNVFYLKEINFTIGKIEKFNERDCYSLINQEKPSSDGTFYVVYYYFDTESGLLLGKKSFKNITPDEIRYDFYKDYSNIDGILFPMSTIKIREKDKTTKIRRTIKLNQGLTKSDFK